MARRCAVTGKRMQTGNNVSHAKNKTRRRFNPNVQQASLLSDALGQVVRMKISTHAIRSIEHGGGLDLYLLNTPDRKLAAEAVQVKRRIKQALGEATA